MPEDRDDRITIEVGVHTVCQISSGNGIRLRLPWWSRISLVSPNSGSAVPNAGNLGGRWVDTKNARHRVVPGIVTWFGAQLNTSLCPEARTVAGPGASVMHTLYR